jgi:hypothetical protein
MDQHLLMEIRATVNQHAPPIKLKQRARTKSAVAGVMRRASWATAAQLRHSR